MKTCRLVYCDNAPELLAALLALGLTNPTSTPACPETNGIAEQKVKHSKSGTRCMVIQSGLEISWWEICAPAFAFCHNLITIIRWPGDPKLCPYERRHKEQCSALILAVGTLVDFMKTPFPKNTHLHRSAIA